jgi:hypothetical protein
MNAQKDILYKEVNFSEYGVPINNGISSKIATGL